MCSKCYRDTRPQQTHDNNKPEPPKAEIKAPAPVVQPQVAEQPQEEQEQDDRKIQKDTTRCWSCTKKVGLLGFKCRCDYVYCATHRYSDKHECSFDYKSMNKAALQKANPVVKGSKLEKI
jgi:hypothetical protein